MSGFLPFHTVSTPRWCRCTPQVLLQTDDYNNLTLKGGNWTYDMPAVEALLQQLSKEQKIKKKVCHLLLHVTCIPLRALQEAESAE